MVDNNNGKSLGRILKQRRLMIPQTLRELAAMSAWLEAKPKQAKTKRGAPRFCVNWLSRAQDRGGASPMAKSSGLIVKTRDMTSLDELSHNFMGDPDMRDHFIEKFGQCFENGVRYT